MCDFDSNARAPKQTSCGVSIGRLNIMSPTGVLDVYSLSAWTQTMETIKEFMMKLKDAVPSAGSLR